MAKFTCDYLQIYETRLNEEFNKFTSSCDNFHEKLDDVEDIIRRDFNDSECGVTMELNECSVKEDYKNMLREMASLTRLREKLKVDLKNEKLMENFPKKIDAELIGLPLWIQNERLLDRVMKLEYSKKLAKKSLNELQKQLEAYQERETHTIMESKIQENLVSMNKSYQKTIEKEVNAEIERVKINFAQVYFEKLKVKNKYDKTDVKIRTEIMPTLNNLQISIANNKFEMEKTNEEMIKQLELQKAQESLEVEFSEKVEFLERDINSKLNDIVKLEEEIKHTHKISSKISELIQKEKDESRDNLEDIRENNYVYQRINFIYQADLNKKLDELEDDTWDNYDKDEKMIKVLKNKICEVLGLICESNVVIEQLKLDIDHHMARDGKFITGVDYTGGNFIKVNK